MNKIYITSLHFRHGGIEKIIANIANALDQEGFSVEILCTYDYGKPAYYLNSNVTITYLLPFLPNRCELRAAISERHFLKAIKEAVKALNILYLKKYSMKKAIQAINAGTIISTRHENSLLLSKYGSPNVNKIAQLHIDHAFDNKLLSDFRNKYHGINYFALLTDKSAEEIKSVMKGYNDSTKVISVPNFIEETCTHSVERKKQVISVGRLHDDKNFEALLRIWSTLAPKHPDWQLKIIGEGDLEGSLKEMAAKLGIQNSVLFAGALLHPRVMEELALSTCYAMTSRFESFGIALVEAMSCGTPAVAFNVRVGPEFIIEDGVDGFLIPDKDELTFADKLESLMKNDDEFKRMSENAQKKAERFTKSAVIGKWLEILDEKFGAEI